MKKSKLDISIIIVNYKVEKELLACIKSILEIKPKTTYEIIVVDNDEDKTLEKNLKKVFPQVLYIPNSNNGWGGGTNIGAGKAKGRYLYFLNPDTIFLNNALDISIDFYEKHQDAGVVASLLFNKNKVEYPQQGSRELTPIRALYVYTFLNKYWPHNPVSNKFYKKVKNKEGVYEVEVATLSAALISSQLFKEVGMFDTNYFLYFEEYDLARRLNKLRRKNYILPSAKVLHFWESSTKQINNRNHILEKSRRYYFKKHFGVLKARLLEAILRRNLKMLVLE